MIGKNIIGSRPTTLAEVSSVLEKRLEEAEAEFKKMKKEKKAVVVEKPPEPPPEPAEGGESASEGGTAPSPQAPAAPLEEKSPLGLEQRYALEYAKKFAKLGKRKAEEMFATLMKVEKMKPEAAAKLVDILPKNPEQVKFILSKERITASDKDAADVLKIVDDFRK